MPTIVFLPHPKYCPVGAVIEVQSGDKILDIALSNGINIEHACDYACACTTCHCIIREGFQSLAKISELEDDMLDKAWGLEKESRLSCQTIVADQNLVIEIPRYTINHTRDY
ncbi:2Fe-2S ferredoxin [Candidatus Profftia lariciata]|uniref:ISC system 2Fe-2S type ferredoxin n=1 Tax=Candidatus Profftia lariciata TaxID=1987921 RepID=UPI001D0110DB|nr:ISC system 2Fe-2S type ferredoxin [Candidatus Profftia lariciata]UDG81798.1 2Fe-2S ferredoxin [Candidatus Profftia lariciata]